ncbi:hypothetical protein TVNIR_3077 [Thioalkalivibrio nitratireducens DSM 14787]|uniref:Uncharacterized protein n=1 Tax=Thioalkalivibrio nitratireducens (strain DSM 14787 / UNIQEM 213 / ALEN2) TaxID=1255043 RepID=L0DYP3_THIND|nr:hypothetical protein [Thioalkalivibrio nitratireducens]AGA34714.1 hypothetical protein TVNIR_3077 [Thioalkalivibrio nitratireducens DSM 14787]
MAMQPVPGPVAVPARYAEHWNDDFGVRGWKLDVPGTGPDVIAGTPYTGERIPTSVFVHDLVDHHLCGFRLSGYLDEAGALVQLAQRTGSDPVADFQQIIDEDLLPGAVMGVDWTALLPASVAAGIGPGNDPRDALQTLRRELGDGVLRALFTAGFVHQGWLRRDAARAAWTAQGLDYAARPYIALALQELFEWMDAQVQTRAWSHARGDFAIGNDAVGFLFREPAGERHTVAVAPPPDQDSNETQS